MGGNSEYIQGIVDAVSKCSEINGRDKYHFATQVFFKNLLSLTSFKKSKSGNRTFLSKSIELSIIAGFKAIPGVGAESNPTIVWDGRKNTSDFPNKQLDIIAYDADKHDKAVVIEQKGRGFNPIAAAIMEFGVALTYGLRIETKNISIYPSHSQFTVLLGDSTSNDFIYFEMMKFVTSCALIEPKIYCLFLDYLVEEKDFSKIFSNVYRFYRENVTFLLNT